MMDEWECSLSNSHVDMFIQMVILIYCAQYLHILLLHVFTSIFIALCIYYMNTHMFYIHSVKYFYIFLLGQVNLHHTSIIMINLIKNFNAINPSAV